MTSTNLPETLGVAILGTGNVAISHARAAQEVAGVELRAVAEIDDARRSEWLSKSGRDGAVTGYADYRDLLKREDVHIVVITLPHWLHGEAAVAAAAAGKHVLVEKPMAITLEECDRMIEAARRAGVVLAVGLTHHFHAVPVEAKKILDSGRLGNIVWASQVMYAPRRYGSAAPWFFDRAKGGGQLMSNGVHYLDRMLWAICGPADAGATARPARARPVAVSAIVGTYFNTHEPAYKSDDGSLVFIRFDTGQAATMHLTGHYQGFSGGYAEYRCQKGMLKYTSQQVFTTNPDNPEDTEYHEVPVQPRSGFSPQLANLADAIRIGGTPAVPGEWGRLVMRVLLAAEESSRLGREVRLEG